MKITGGTTIDHTVTKSISRMARNTVTLLETVQELKAMGITVYFEKQNIGTGTDGGELMHSIHLSRLPRRQGCHRHHKVAELRGHPHPTGIHLAQKCHHPGSQELHWKPSSTDQVS